MRAASPVPMNKINEMLLTANLPVQKRNKRVRGEWCKMSWIPEGESVLHVKVDAEGYAAFYYRGDIYRTAASALFSGALTKEAY